MCFCVCVGMREREREGERDRELDYDAKCIFYCEPEVKMLSTNPHNKTGGQVNLRENDFNFILILVRILPFSLRLKCWKAFPPLPSLISLPIWGPVYISYLKCSVLKRPATVEATERSGRRQENRDWGRRKEQQSLSPRIWYGKGKRVVYESEDAVEVTWGLVSCAHPQVDCKPGEEFPSMTGSAVDCSLWKLSLHAGKLKVSKKNHQMRPQKELTL